ncbi:MAG: glycosyltransferase family A protein [Solirubrobacteraceae bacterium]
MTELPASNRRLVTCIVPVRDGARYLAQAIDSILAQSYRPIEVIVVDDGSTDESAHIADAYGDPVRLLTQAPSGAAAARNRAVRAAKGYLIAPLDADDIWRPDKLTRQSNYLDAHPAVDIAMCRLETFHDPGPGDRRVIDGYPWVTALMRAHVFERVGYFDESHQFANALDWFVRASEAGVQTARLPDVLVRRRIHAANVSAAPDREDRYFDDAAGILKQHLDRRRSAAADR